MKLNGNLIGDREEDNRLILEKPSTCRHGATGIFRDAPLRNNPIRVLKDFLEIQKKIRDTESPKFDLSSIIEAKVGKLFEVKMRELLGNSL
jgi:hypothetical protein